MKPRVKRLCPHCFLQCGTKARLARHLLQHKLTRLMGQPVYNWRYVSQTIHIKLGCVEKNLVQQLNTQLFTKG